MSTSTGHSSQGSSSLETATETGHDIHFHARCNMLVTWSDSGMHLVSIDYNCTNASHVGQMSWDLVATPNPLPHHYLFPGSGRHCPRTPHPTPRMRAGFGFHNEVKEFSFSVPPKDGHYWVHLQSRNLSSQELLLRMDIPTTRLLAHVLLLLLLFLQWE